jgi:hypothetical protein
VIIVYPQFRHGSFYKPPLPQNGRSVHRILIGD